MSSGVRFKSISCRALSSMFVDLRFARSTALRPRSHATSDRCHGGAGVKWAHHVQLNNPALPDFIDETKTTKENRI